MTKSEIEINLEELNEIVDNFKSEFENYGGFEVKLIHDLTMPDYYGNRFLPFYIKVSDPDNGVTVEVLINKDHNTEYNVYEDIYESVHPWDVWKYMYFQASKALPPVRLEKT